MLRGATGSTTTPRGEVRGRERARGGDRDAFGPDGDVRDAPRARRAIPGRDRLHGHLGGAGGALRDRAPGGHGGLITAWCRISITGRAGCDTSSATSRTA